jgi:asparagine synthase (glutamine-hydrolysing)
MFGRWQADFGDPPDWQLDPITHTQWDRTKDLMRAISASDALLDVKSTWEIGRFSHAYLIARAAAFFPEHRAQFASAMLSQMRNFEAANVFGLGVHWTSGQEVAFRLLAWVFVLDTLLLQSQEAREARALVADTLVAGATWIERHINYARGAVYNNHLLSEALGLFAVGVLLPAAPSASRWRTLGRRLLDQEAERQFYEDGAYICQSHNYHRLAIHDLLWAAMFARSSGDRPSVSWLRALDRSLTFLVSHQNPGDGRLPNYGANDGSHALQVACCDVSDFRPTLQTVSVLVRNERLYEPGPWDEAVAWLLGPDALDAAPLRPPRRRSASFGPTGFHVLRGSDASSFVAFRCGTLKDRFSQVDMLHADVWWRGQNVLVDAGSYRYNGYPEWHRHFMGTGVHNTVVIDGRDQMLHFRTFKVLYWTRAALRRFVEHDEWALVEGEHYGYTRHPGRCEHRRTILQFGNDTWVVVDRITGTGSHKARLHWLCGEFAYQHAPGTGGLVLETPSGPFAVNVVDTSGTPLRGTVAEGQVAPPRGWQSRYYGEKQPVPSLEVIAEGLLPQVFVSVLSGEPLHREIHGETWLLRAEHAEYRFSLTHDGPHHVSVQR